MKSTLKRWLLGSTLVALLFTSADAVNAGYGSSGGSGGSGGGYGSAGYGSSGGYYGGSVGGGSSGGGSSGNVGPLRRLGARLHDHMHAKVAARSAGYGSSGYGSSGGRTSGYGSSGGSYGGSGGGYVTRNAGSGGGSSGGGSYYGSSYSAGGSSGHFGGAGSSGGNSIYGGGSSGYSGGSSGYSGGSSGTIMNYSPSMPMQGGYESSGTIVTPAYSPNMSGASARTQSANKLASSNSIQPNEVHLTVKLPEMANVFVNGNSTTTTGQIRHFISRDLKEGGAYRFEVKAVLKNDDGTEIVQNKTVVVNSGYGEELSFDMKKADDPVETILTLNVPENATVVLAKNATKSDGTSRVYRTKQLREGEAWDDYNIEVTHNGVTKEKTIRLIGGDKLELSFNFDSEKDSNKVAMR